MSDGHFHTGAYRGYEPREQEPIVKCSAVMVKAPTSIMLDCDLVSGHRGPHRDGGWPVLWTDRVESRRWNARNHTDGVLESGGAE